MGRPIMYSPEVRELRRANVILRKASAYFSQAELDRRPRRWPPSYTELSSFFGNEDSQRSSTVLDGSSSADTQPGDRHRRN